MVMTMMNTLTITFRLADLPVFTDYDPSKAGANEFLEGQYCGQA